MSRGLKLSLVYAKGVTALFAPLININIFLYLMVESTERFVLTLQKQIKKIHF